MRSKIPDLLRQAVQFVYNRSFRRIRIDSPPVFIVGCGHSGTSILLRMLGAHSRIHAIPYESGLARQPNPQLLRLSFNMQTVAARKRRWVEKTPSHIHHIRRLLEIERQSKIILIIRDGRDVVCSIQDREGSIESGISRWLQDNRAGEEFWNHPNVHLLRYEELVQSPEVTLKLALTFLAENYEPEMLDYHHQSTSLYSVKKDCPPNAFGPNHEAYRNWQINQPLFDGRGRWKRLTEGEKQQVKSGFGDTLARYGYAQDAEW